MKINKENNDFRMYCKNFFLTFSQIEYKGDLGIYKERIIDKFKDTLVYACVGYGNHGEKGDHIHVYLEFIKRKNIKNKHSFDFICEKHPSIEKVKHQEKALNYIKNHSMYIEWGEREKKKNLRVEIDTYKGDIIKLYDHADERIKDLLYKEGSKANVYAKGLVTYQRYEEVLKKKEMKYFDIEILKNHEKYEKYSKYIDTIIPVLELINKLNKDRHYRSRNILINSYKPGIGKTSLLNLLNKVTPCYQWPEDLWFPSYRNETFQYILWDEFTLRSFPEEFMKKLLAGNELQLPVKGTHVHKTDNPLIIGTSNNTLKSHVLKKYSTKCVCSREDDGTQLCKKTKECTTKEESSNLYNALYSRLKIIKIEKSLFPDGEENPQEWEEYVKIMQEAIEY